MKIEETKEFKELLENIKDGFKLVPALKVISECDNILALETLKKQIDKKISKLKVEG